MTTLMLSDAKQILSSKETSMPQAFLSCQRIHCTNTLRQGQQVGYFYGMVNDKYNPQYLISHQILLSRWGEKFLLVTLENIALN